MITKTLPAEVSVMKRIVEYEYKIVSIIYNHPDLIDYVLRLIPTSSFNNITVKEISFAIAKVYEQGGLLDIPTVSDEVNKRHKIYDSLVLEVLEYSFENDYKNIDQIIETYLKLKSDLDLSNFNVQGLLEKGYDAEQIQDKLADIVYAKKNSYVLYEFKDLVIKTKEYLDSEDSHVIYTGLDALDKKLQIKNTNLIILSARPKQGKTSFALNMMMQASSQHQHSCLYFSFEMSGEEIMQKLMKHPLYQENATYPVKIIEAAGLSVPEIKSIMLKENPDLTLIDQLDCLPVVNNNDRHDLKVGKNVSDLKKICMEIKKPIILLHQLNRNADKNKKPELYNLKDSGVIEQKADIVLMLWKATKEGEDNLITFDVKLIIGANRMNASGSIMYLMKPAECNFLEVDYAAAAQEKYRQQKATEEIYKPGGD